MIMFTNTLYDSTWQHTKNFSMKMSLEFFPHYEILQSLFGQSFNLKIISLNIMRVYFTSGGFLLDKIISKRGKVLLGHPTTSPGLSRVRLVGLDTKFH